MPDDGAAALEALFWRDEILQALFWLQGERLAERARRPSCSASWLPTGRSSRRAGRLVAEGYVERDVLAIA